MLYASHATIRTLDIMTRMNVIEWCRMDFLEKEQTGQGVHLAVITQPD